MAKLRCSSCGHILRDSTLEQFEGLWGHIVSNGEMYAKEEKLASVLAGLCVAYRDGSHTDWLNQNVNVFTEQEIQPIISDIITGFFSDIGVDYGKCEKCETLMIQKNKEKNTYVPYTPDKEKVCEEI